MTKRIRLEIRKIGFGFVLWLLLSFYIAANFAPWQLAADVTTDGADVAQLFYSKNGAWNEVESLTRPLGAGSNALTFTLPLLWPGEAVRFDPGQRPVPYRIARLRWIHGGLTMDVPFDRVHDPRSTGCNLSKTTALLMHCSDNDSQLIIPAPDFGWMIASCITLLALPLFSLLPLLWLARRLAPTRTAGVFLALCASCYVFVTLVHGPILPLYDDWRYLYPGPFDLVDGDNWQWLTVVGNDTYFLTNQLIDFVVLKLSNADFFWVRIVALALLLLQLALQYRVLTRAVNNDSIVGGIAVALAVWSLASDGFWGGTAVAYQQFLPTLFATCSLAVLLAKDFSLRRIGLCGLLILFSVASGLSYISGGLMVLCLGICCLLFGTRRAQATDSGIYRAGWLLAGLGTALLLLQIALVNHHQGSLLEHNHAVASVYPTDRRFWLFFIALFGRALGYTGTFAPLDVGLTFLFIAPAIFLTIQRLFFARPVADAAASTWWRLLPVFAGIGGASYAMAVAFGRSGFISVDATTVSALAMGKMRFHYWPIAAMVPYVWLGWVELAKQMRFGRSIQAVAALILLIPKSTTAFAHDYYVSSAKDASRTGAACVASLIHDLESNRPIICTTLTGVPLNLSPVITRLRARHSPVYFELMREAESKDAEPAKNPVFNSGFN